VNAFASALALLRVCSVQQFSLQLDALSDGCPLQWIARLQHQRQVEPLLGVSPLRQLRLSNEDCLYAYTTLMLEQFRCEQDRLALFHAFHDIGHVMNIHDIPCTIEALECFQHQYEGQHCFYTACNERIARAIGDYLIRRLPIVLRPLGYVGISSLIDEHVREALGLPGLCASLRSKVRWVITTYQHRTSWAEGQSISFECQDSACEYAMRLFRGCRSDPVEFLLYALCFARAAPPIVMNEPQVL
jgi:hypothetical protein